MVDFARTLPKLREQVERTCGSGGSRARGCSPAPSNCSIAGSSGSGRRTTREENETYGLVTMRKRHVTVNGNTLVFDYEAKGGKRRVQTLADRKVSRLVKALRERRGGGNELLAYRNGAEWRDIRSTEINDYIKDTIGRTSAKDFRTWNATVLAAVVLAASARERDMGTKGDATERSATRSIRYRTTWGTRRRSAGSTSTRGSSTASTGLTVGGVFERLQTIPPTGLRFRGRSRRPCSTSSIGESSAAIERVT